MEFILRVRGSSDSRVLCKEFNFRFEVYKVFFDCSVENGLEGLRLEVISSFGDFGKR